MAQQPSLTRDALRSVVTAWTPGIQPTWTISQVRSALAAHARGDLSQSAKLADAMCEHSEIAQGLEKRVDALMRAEFSLCPVSRRVRARGSRKPRKEPVPASEKLADWLDETWWDYAPEEQLTEALRNYHQLGAAIITVDWVTGASTWSPRLRALPMHFACWDESIERWRYQARDGLHVVEPGNGKWIVLEKGPRGWLRGAVMPMGVQWVASGLGFRDWGRFSERHGLPIVKAKIPIVADNDDKDAFWDDLKELGSEVTAQLPQGLGIDEKLGFDLELLEAKDTGWQGFDAYLNRIDRKIQIFYTGGNLGTEVVDQGARAAAETHDSGLSGKATSDAQKVSTTLRAQFVYPVCALNRAAKLEDCPWPTWKTRRDADTSKAAAALKTFGEGLNQIKTAGYRVVNVDDLAKQYGIELVEEEPPEPNAVPSSPKAEAGQDDRDEEDETAEGSESADGEPGEDEELQSVALASGDPPAKARGFVDGLEYAGRVGADYAAGAHSLLADDLATVVALIDECQSYDELALRLRGAYSGMSLAKLAELTQKAIILSNLAGRTAVQQDL